MKAVNLIPPEQRRGGSGTGRSGGLVYVLLGMVAFAVVGVAVYVLSANSVSDRQAELTKLQAETQTAQARADALSPYRQFESLKQSRVKTIQQLASSRFDWERALRKLAIVIPNDVWLKSLVGTVNPTVTVDESGGGNQSGGASDSSTLRSALPVPALELVGCTTGQAQVSRFMSRLRAIDGVTRVSLSSSAKADDSAGGGASGGACGNGGKSRPQFDMIVFFEATTAAPGVGGAASPTASTAAPPSGPANTTNGPQGSK
jgi:Tfp pilus assembly protein PilN